MTPVGVDILKVTDPNDEKLKGVTLDDVARAQVGIVNMVKEHKADIEKGGRTRDESFEEFKTRLSTLGEMVDSLKELRPTNPDAHLTEIQGNYAARKGGLFKKGAPLLDYEKMISISPNSRIVRGEDQELLKDFHDAHDAMMFQVMLHSWKLDTGAKPGNLYEAQQRAYKSADFKRYEDLVKFTGYTKANEIVHSATGGMVNPLTQSITSGTIFDLVRLQLNVANQFQEFPMQNFDVKVPVNRGDGIGVRGGANAGDPPPKDAFTSPIPPAAMLGSFTLGQAALVAENVLAFLVWNDNAVPDSVAPLVPYLRNQIALMHARAIDRACMSGDEQARTQGNHMDDHASAFTVQDARALWNGLRRIGANYYTDNAGAALDATDVRAMLRRMGVYGMAKSDLRMWMNTGPLYDMLGDSDVVTTFQGSGNASPVITGELARIYGIPMLPTEWIPTDLDGTTGFSTAIGTQTAAVLANVSRFLLGNMGTVSVEVTRIAPMLANVIQAAARYDFVPLEAVDGSGIFAAGATVPLDIVIDLPS